MSVSRKSGLQTSLWCLHWPAKCIYCSYCNCFKYLLHAAVRDCSCLAWSLLVLLDPFLSGLSLPVLFEWLDINCMNTRMLGDVMIWSIVYFHMFIPILSILVYNQQSGQLVSENDVLNLWSSGFKAALAWIIHFVMPWFQLIIDSCLFACLLGLVCWTRHYILTPQLVFILAWVADSSVNLFYIHISILQDRSQRFL